MKNVIVSNGFHKFPLANAAAELHGRGLLAELVTGPYPDARVRSLLRVPGASGTRLARLGDRQAALPDGKVRALWWPEAMEKAATTLRRLPAARARAVDLEVRAYQAYGDRARAAVRRYAGKADIYHYRAGFGHRSVPLAKSLGMLTVCDHTAAHPALFQHLRENGGAFPEPGTRGPMPPLWRSILADIEQADVVLANSRFVKQTFVHQGWDPGRIGVVYPGIDDRFFAQIPPRRQPGAAKPVRLLFAGSFDRGKGAIELIEALQQTMDEDWTLDLVGPVADEVRARFAGFLRSPRINVRGLVRRHEVARSMARADIFVFPSLAEGSARVVYEALASGCFVITTPNSADLEDGVHGALVPPGDVPALAGALRRALADRERLAVVGARNAAWVRGCLRQVHYGDALVDAYEAFLEQRARQAPGAK